MAKAGAKIDFSKFLKTMGKAYSQMESREEMQAAGEFCVGRIVRRTRVGQGVSRAGAESESLKPLSQSYRQFRAGKIAFFRKGAAVVPYKPDAPPPLAGTTTPGKSNLTLSGQLLASIKVLTAGAGRAVIGAAGDRLNFLRGKSLLSNADVAGFVSKERPFLNLSRAELNGLQRFWRDRISAAIKKSLT
jgi:hypothetical protein